MGASASAGRKQPDGLPDGTSINPKLFCPVLLDTNAREMSVDTTADFIFVAKNTFAEVPTFFIKLIFVQ
jgi:hypothetical protein